MVVHYLLLHEKFSAEEQEGSCSFLLQFLALFHQECATSSDDVLALYLCSIGGIRVHVHWTHSNKGIWINVIILLIQKRGLNLKPSAKVPAPYVSLLTGQRSTFICLSHVFDVMALQTHLKKIHTSRNWQQKIKLMVSKGEQGKWKEKKIPRSSKITKAPTAKKTTGVFHEIYAEPATIDDNVEISKNPEPSLCICAYMHISDILFTQYILIIRVNIYEKDLCARVKLNFMQGGSPNE